MVLESVVLAALKNALLVVGKSIREVNKYKIASGVKQYPFR